MSADINVATPQSLIVGIKTLSGDAPSFTDPEEAAKWWMIVVREVLSQAGLQVFDDVHDTQFLEFIFKDQDATSKEHVEAICLHLIDRIQYSTEQIAQWEVSEVLEQRKTFSDMGFFLYFDATEYLKLFRKD